MKVEGQHKKEWILTVAKQLFKVKGVADVSVQEICLMAGFSEQEFHECFSDKFEISKSLVSEILDGAYEKYEACFAKDIPYLEKAQELLELQYEFVKGFSQQFVENLLKGGHEEINALVQQKIQKRNDLVMSNYIAAQKNGEIRSDINPKFVEFIFFELKDLMSNPYLQAMYDSPEELWLEILKYHFYGIAGKEE